MPTGRVVRLIVQRGESKSAGAIDQVSNDEVVEGGAIILPLLYCKCTWLDVVHPCLFLVCLTVT
jgi:hypothetical protein